MMEKRNWFPVPVLVSLFLAGLATLPVLAGGSPRGTSRCARLVEAGKWQEAVPACRQEAEKGNPVAQYHLGLLYGRGKGVPKDPAEAYRWIRRAADQGMAEAMFELGRMYAAGEGTERCGSAAADRFYRAGLAYLAEGRRDEALRCVEEIVRISRNAELLITNDFLRSRLVRSIYRKELEDESPAKEPGTR